MLLTLDTLTAGGHFDGIAPVIDGIQYVLTDLTGWWGAAPAPELKHTKRPTAHGAHRSAAYRGTRSYGLKVTATSVAESPAEMRRVENRIAAICSDPAELYRLAVEDQGGVRCAYVELDGDIVPELRDGLAWSTVFSIPVVASDPFRYDVTWGAATAPGGVTGAGGIDFTGSGAVFTTPGLVMGTAGVSPVATVTGAGAVESQLVFRVDGPTSGVQITDMAGSSVVALRGETLAGQATFINCSPSVAFDVPGCPDPIPAYGVLSGGANARGAVAVTGGWPRLRAGETRSFLFSGLSGAAAALTVHARGAYF